MTEQTLPRPAPRGWLVSLEARRWGVLALWSGLSAALVAGMLLWWAVFGFWGTLFDPAEPLGLSFDARNHLSLAVLLAFVIAATRWVRRESVQSLRDLGPASSLPADTISELIHQASTSSLTIRVSSVLCGAVAGTAVIALTGRDPGRYLSLSAWDAHHVWAIGTNIALFSSMLRSALGGRTGWRVLDRMTRSMREIDLLDREALTRVGRYGLPSALLWLVASSLASFLAWGMANVTPLVVILCGTLAAASFSLLRPVQIVRGRVREAKQIELRRVRERITRAKAAALEGGPGATGAAAELPGLLAYEARIDSVNESPFDTPTLFRFAALALLAVGSWLGGAVVERALGAVLE